MQNMAEFKKNDKKRIKTFNHTTLPPSKLVKAVAKSSKYHEYEVRDILLHLAVVTRRELANAGSVHIEGIGKIGLINRGIRKYYSGMLGREIETKRPWLLKLQGETSLIEFLDENFDWRKAKEKNDTTISEPKDNPESN